MSEQEQVGQESGNVGGGTALKALAGAAATGAATYAVRKALATRNDHDDQNADEHEADEVDPNGEIADDQMQEPDDSEYADDEDDDRPEASADEDGEESEEPDGDDEDQRVSEGSADEKDEVYEDDEPDPSRLASLSHLFVPLAGVAADSAGRYVAEHTSDVVQQQVVSRFIDAFEKAS